MNPVLLTCFLSSLRRFISAALSSLLIPTRLGCVAFVVDCCGAGGVAVCDRLGATCLRGVTARRGIAVNGFIPTRRLADYGATHSQLGPAMGSLRVVRRRSRVPGQVRFQKHLDQ